MLAIPHISILPFTNKKALESNHDSMPDLPTDIAEVKITNEAPQGLRMNLEGSYLMALASAAHVPPPQGGVWWCRNLGSKLAALAATGRLSGCGRKSPCTDLPVWHRVLNLKASFSSVNQHRKVTWPARPVRLPAAPQSRNLFRH